MTYLGGLRLHFAGQFQANISTVNNDPAHFDNARFLPEYQKMQGPSGEPPNGWFNPEGDANWRLLGCRVTSAWTPAGQVSAPDPVLRYLVADSDEQVPAKLVDLDSQQQLASEIWGLQVRVTDVDGTTLLRGDFEPAAFIDLWGRATAGGDPGDMGAAAAYQSVLTNLRWGNVSASPFLTALQQAAGDGLLSIKFNLDGLNMSSSSADFLCGRIVGTIGPAAAGEPHHMVIGRQFMTEVPVSDPFPRPAGKIYFCAAVVDEPAGRLYLDLGNAVPTTSPGGPPLDQGDLTLTVAGQATPLGTIPASAYAGDPDWYATTAGVVELPLTPDQLDAVAGAPLALSGNPGVRIAEWPSGAFVRADRFVHRVSPGEPFEIEVYATRFGRPLDGTEVRFDADRCQLQGSDDDGGADPPVATPPEALGLAPDATAHTGPDGRAVLTITPGDPGTPRFFRGGDYGIDGQVYAIRPAFADEALDGGPVNQWNFVSVLLASGFTPSDPVTWADVQPIFQQYANLYPVMGRFLDLGDYDSVVANTGFLQLVFGLDPTDPNAMPVTRDLSPAKRQAITTWLKDPLPAPAPRSVAAREAVAPPAPAATMAPSQHGKAAAMARRLVLRQP